MINIDLRPRSFGQIHGQEVVMRGINKLATLQKWHQSILIKGTSGTGKTTLAQLIAMNINCESIKENGDPCCSCRSCKSVIEERFDLGVEMINGGSSSKGELVDFVEMASSSSLYSKNRVYIIEEADQLSTKAINSLLKVLEKPMKNVYFILLSMEQKALGNAVQSRCQNYNFFPFTVQQTMLGLMDDLKRADMWMLPEVPKSFYMEVIPLLADSCHGSYRQALQLVQNCWDAEIWTKEEAEKNFGVVGQEQVVELIGSLLDCNASAIPKISNLDSQEFFGLAYSVLSASLLFKVSGISEDERFIKQYSLMASKQGLESLCRLFSDVHESSGGFLRPSYLMTKLSLWYSEQPKKIIPSDIPVAPKVIRRIVGG